MAGGGGKTGGTVVGGPSKWAAYQAGNYQANAATEAAQLYQDSINTAISQMNQHYQQARYDVQPYRTEGVQALNQLNQYLQLDPYNPGAAPEVTQSDIDAYIKANSRLLDVESEYSNDANYKNGPHRGYHAQYTGVGARELLNATNQRVGNTYDQSWATGTPQGQDPEEGYTIAGNRLQGYGLNDFYGNTIINNAVRSELEGLQARDKAEWAQNKAWYDKYKAEGPYTQQQISDKISNLPGYQAELQQGVDAIGKMSASRGYLGSGRLMKELSQYGQNTLSKFYGQELDRLAQLAGAGQQAATFSAQSSMQTGQGKAGLYQSLGDTKANSALAKGNALAQALLAGNQEYQIIGQQDSGGGGLGGLGSVLGGIGSIMGAMPSSKALKNKINTPSTKEILKSLKELDIDRWQYKGIEDTHIGPYAEDFQDKFNVGNGQSINIIDALGVLFASVQELSKQVDLLTQREKKDA